MRGKHKEIPLWNYCNQCSTSINIDLQNFYCPSCRRWRRGHKNAVLEVRGAATVYEAGTTLVSQVTVTASARKVAETVARKIFSFWPENTKAKLDFLINRSISSGVTGKVRLGMYVIVFGPYKRGLATPAAPDRRKMYFSPDYVTSATSMELQ